MGKRNSKLKVVEQVRAPAPPATWEDRLVRIIETANHDVEYAKKVCDAFVERFNTRPSDALSWSSDTFKQAARYDVAKTILAWIEQAKEQGDEYCAGRSAKEVIMQVREILHGEVMRAAKWPERSTSVPSNEISLCVMAQKAEWLERLDNVVERMKEAG